MSVLANASGSISVVGAFHIAMGVYICVGVGYSSCVSTPSDVQVSWLMIVAYN